MWIPWLPALLCFCRFGSLGPDWARRQLRNSRRRPPNLPAWQNVTGLEPLSSRWRFLAITPRGKDPRCAVVCVDGCDTVFTWPQGHKRRPPRDVTTMFHQIVIFPDNCIIVSMVKKTLFLLSTQDVNSVALPSGCCSPTIDGACKWSCIQQPASRLDCSCIAQPDSCNLDDRVL